MINISFEKTNIYESKLKTKDQFLFQVELFFRIAGILAPQTRGKQSFSPRPDLEDANLVSRLSYWIC